MQPPHGTELVVVCGSGDSSAGYLTTPYLGPGTTAGPAWHRNRYHPAGKENEETVELGRK